MWFTKQFFIFFLDANDQVDVRHRAGKIKSVLEAEDREEKSSWVEQMVLKLGCPQLRRKNEINEKWSKESTRSLLVESSW